MVFLVFAASLVSGYSLKDHPEWVWFVGGVGGALMMYFMERDRGPRR